MKKNLRRLSALIFLALYGVFSAAGNAQPAATPVTPHSFRVENGKFMLDGKPFQIIAGEMHYARIPRAYWRARLRMAKAMGLNTVTTYVFWNFHEPRPGEYDFTGQHDVAEFVREAQSEGLYVNLRPGPYSCAEWEWGGFPSWLLKDHGIVVRSADPKFMEPARRWLLRLGKELAPLQVGNGGPIIMVQVENEYGSFGNDHAYMEQIHHDLVDAGFDKSSFYTADGVRRDSRRFTCPSCRPESISLQETRRRHSQRAQAAPRRTLHGHRMVGWLVRSLGRPPPHHRR